MWRSGRLISRKPSQSAARRRLSKDTSGTAIEESQTEASVEECARALSWMGQHLSHEASSAVTTPPEVAMKWAHQLSREARIELARVRSTSTLPAATQVPEPPKRELRLVALNQAIPFVGFGIMDNSILIIAGDAIDTSLGVVLGISTMCAAAIGNIVSDVAGVMLGAVIEDYTARLGLPVPTISAAQRQLRSVRFSSQFGCGVGLVIGCFIGMFPLLWIDSNKAQRMKQEAHMDSIFKDVVTEAKGLIGAQSTRMFLVVDTPTSTTPSSQDTGNPYLYGKYVYGEDNKTKGGGKAIRVPLGRGIVSRTALTGEALNVYDVQTETDFAKDIWELQLDIKNMACVPVFDSHGRVIAVIQAINKVGKGIATDDDPPTRNKTRGGFTNNDVQILKVLASHVSVSLQSMYGEDAELTLRDTIRILKEHGLAALLEDSSSGGSRLRKLFVE